MSFTPGYALELGVLVLVASLAALVYLWRDDPYWIGGFVTGVLALALFSL